MFKKRDRNEVRMIRHERVRKKISGTPARPRLSVYRSNAHIYAQIIDDEAGNTLVAASTVEKDIASQISELDKKGASKLVGKIVAERALEKGIKVVVFDRGGYIYTGRVAELAAGAREGGLDFKKEEMNAMQRNEQVSEFKEKLVAVNRVSKTVKGGRNMRFSALMVVGDENGRVGCGMGKAAEIPEAIRKGIEDAKKNMVTVPMVGTTIPHEVVGVFGTGKVLLMPAPEGTGVIAGGPGRSVLESLGIKDIRTKSIGSNNPINMVKATLAGLKQLRSAEQVARLRGKTVEELLG